MSSYFDEAARAIDRAESEEAKNKLVDKVVKRVGDYLGYIESRCLKAEKGKLIPLREQFTKIRSRSYPAAINYMRIERLHDLGHDIGRARIKIRAGGWAGDNPYFPGHYDRDF